MAQLDLPAPKRDGVRVRIRATAATSSDCLVRGFHLKPSMWIPGRLVLGINRPRRPVLGMVLAGEIDAVGDKVTSLDVGQQVSGFDRFGFGTYAEYKCMPAGGYSHRSPPISATSRPRPFRMAACWPGPS